MLNASAAAQNNNNTFSSNPIIYYGKLFYVYLEQIYLLLRKNISQKQRNGRQFWKETILIQLFILAFVTYIIYQNATAPPSTEVYTKFPLPPLSNQKPFGIFNVGSKGNTANDQLSTRLYYYPNNHDGVNQLIQALTEAYPDIHAIGAADNSAVNTLYEQNLFNTWASLEFTLTTEQLSTGKLVTSDVLPSLVKYQIVIAPFGRGGPLPTYNYSSVYNDELSDADLFWNTGYLTLQNWIATYLAKQYSFVDSNFNVS